MSIMNYSYRNSVGRNNVPSLEKDRDNNSYTYTLKEDVFIIQRLRDGWWLLFTRN